MRAFQVAIRPGWVAVLGLALLIAGCSNQGGEPEQKKAPEVGVVTLQAQPVELFTTLPGRTTPYRVAEVRPQVNGIIEKRSFREGDQVRSGQTLYRIDARPYRARVNSAEADLARARAAVTSVKRRVARYAELVDTHAVSQQEYDDARAQLAQKQAEVGVAEAALETARINLDYTSVEAPIAGQIGRSFFTEGALVTANQPKALAKITRLDPIYVDIPRASDEVLRLKRAFANGTLKKAGPGQAQVRLLLDDGSEYDHTGKLLFSDVTVEPDTGSVTLRAIFPNPDHNLLPGMFVRARLSEGVRQNALLVPQQGVTRNSKGDPIALVVGEGDKLEQRSLDIDRAIGAYWVVTEGLAAGDRLVVSGRQGVASGDKVKPVPADIPNKPGAATSTTGPGGKSVPKASADDAEGGHKGGDPSDDDSSGHADGNGQG